MSLVLGPRPSVRPTSLVLGPVLGSLCVVGPRTPDLDQVLWTDDGPRTKAQGPRTTKKP